MSIIHLRYSVIFTNLKFKIYRHRSPLVFAGRVESGSGYMDPDPAFQVNLDLDQDMDPFHDPDPGF
jgi:hypothetical protein